MAYLDDFYSPEEAPAQQQLPESDFIGRGSAITEHIASTPDLARQMRYSPGNARRQEMQDYLGPLAAQDFAAEARRAGSAGGVVAALGSPAYAGLKAVAPETTSEWTGTGEALPSQASIEQVLRAYRGLGFGVEPTPGTPTPEEVRAALAGAQGPAALQREVVGAQVRDAEIDPAATGRVQWGPETPWYRGGAFTPNDVLPTAAALLPGGAAATGALARGIAPVAQRAAAAAPATSADLMFAPAAQAGRAAVDVPVGIASLGAGNAAASGLSGLGSDLMAWAMRRAGRGIEFPAATQAHPSYRKD